MLAMLLYRAIVPLPEENPSRLVCVLNASKDDAGGWQSMVLVFALQRSVIDVLGNWAAAGPEAAASKRSRNVGPRAQCDFPHLDDMLQLRFRSLSTRSIGQCCQPSAKHLSYYIPYPVESSGKSNWPEGGSQRSLRSAKRPLLPITTTRTLCTSTSHEPMVHDEYLRVALTAAKLAGEDRSSLRVSSIIHGSSGKHCKVFHCNRMNKVLLQVL